MQVKNGHFAGVWSSTFSAEQSGIGGGNPGTVDLTEVEQAIEVGDIDAEGWCWIKNIGTTNVARLGFSSSFTGGIEILPGESAGPFRLIDGSTLYAKSVLGPTSVQIIILER